MPRRCLICTNPQRQAIENAIKTRHETGHGYRLIANRFGLSKSAVQRHVSAHAPQLALPDELESTMETSDRISEAGHVSGQPDRSIAVKADVLEHPALDKSLRNDTAAAEPQAGLQPVGRDQAVGFQAKDVGLFRTIRDCVGDNGAYYHFGDYEVWPLAKQLPAYWRRQDWPPELKIASDQVGRGLLRSEGQFTMRRLTEEDRLAMATQERKEKVKKALESWGGLD